MKRSPLCDRKVCQLMLVGYGLANIYPVSLISTRRSLLTSTIASTNYESLAKSISSAPMKEQRKHALTSLYRTTTSITSFVAQDPDPNAVNKGKLLGLRIEAFAHRKFTRPYYIFLNQHVNGSVSLRIHRHTVPPAIPLAALSARFLPPPKTGIDRKQDLGKFVRCLRGQIQAYHNRLAAVGSLRKGLRVDEIRKLRGEGEEEAEGVLDISAIDAEAKQLRIEWTDGAVGRIEIGTKGQVVRSVVTGIEGRHREKEQAISGGSQRVEDLLEKLSE